MAEKLVRPGLLSRRNVLIGAGALGAAGLAYASLPPPPQYRAKPNYGRGRRPNILFILTDQERPWDLLPAGLNTPARQRLAQTGLSLTNYHIATPICSQSRATIYSGQQAQHNGVWENVPLPYATDLFSDVPTLGSLMNDVGYHTAYFGKWHLTDLGHNARRTKAEIAEVFRSYGFLESDQDREYGGTLSGYHDDQEIADIACRFLHRRRNQRDPWFATVNLVNPHDIMFFETGAHQAKSRVLDFPDALAREPSDAFYKLAAEIGRPENFGPATMRGKPAAVEEYARVLNVAYGEIPFSDDAAWTRFISYYYRCIEDVDRKLMQILNTLDETELSDDTVVIFSSDHGEMLGTHGLREKGVAPYREIARVPFVIRHPDLQGGSSTPMLASAIDIAPTLLSIAGVADNEIRENYPMLKGRSLGQAISTRAQSGPRDGAGGGVLMQWNGLIYLSAESGAKFKAFQSAQGFSAKLSAARDLDTAGQLSKRGQMRGIFDGRYKFARYFAPNDHHIPANYDDLIKRNDLELYDTQADPGETTNIADRRLIDPAVRKTVETMNAKLSSLIRGEIGEDEGDYIPGTMTFVWRSVNKARRRRAMADV
jgi:arylsulfatase A-like enzyme